MNTLTEKTADEIQPAMRPGEQRSALVAWLPLLVMPYTGHCTSQPLASLGVHVDSFVRDLHQFEMADVVESDGTRGACRMALCGISSRLAGNGCR